MHLPRFVVLASLPLLAACGGSGQDQQQMGGAMPPTLVQAVELKSEVVPNIVELPGRIEAVRKAEVRARTEGIVERLLYREGTDVAAGTPLFRIDPRDYAAQVAQARAALSRAEAARTNAAAIVRRYSPLVAERAVSAQEFDQAQATLRSETANVADARAALQRAQLQLSFTTVRAPISGRVGRAQVTEGALVSGTQGTLLTTIEQPTPVYAIFTQSNAQMLDLIEQRRAGAAGASPSVDVRLVLANGQEYGPTGRLDFTDQVVDPETGTQTMRAIFPNGDRLLLPGQFVRARIALGTNPNGILVPARAVQIGDRGASVTMVAKDGTTSVRPVQLAGQVGNSWLVKSGLKAGERVIVEGWQKVMQPGQKVQVQGDKPPAAAKGAQPQQAGK